MVNAAYTESELVHQLNSSGVKALFTCELLLDTALKAAKQAGIPKERVFILPMVGDKGTHGLTTVEALITEGESLGELEALRWCKGQGARQPAFLCYSSGTSGLPVGINSWLPHPSLRYNAAVNSN
jgi:acyl-CoA synthetase (AMP-forming)/AMP-acid ligase II